MQRLVQRTVIKSLKSIGNRIAESPQDARRQGLPARRKHRRATASPVFQGRSRGLQSRTHGRLAGHEWLEDRRMLAVTFQAETPISATDSNYPKSVFAADFDGDNDADIVVASFFDNRIAWYENLDGLGNYGAQQVISTTAIGASSVYATDLDGDGDPDIISGGSGAYDSDVSWYRNDGADGFTDQLVISADVLAVDSVFAADLDGDGDMDVLSASRGDAKVAWYENDGDGNFGSQELLADDANGATTVSAADLDGDGDMDVVVGANEDNSVRWFRNEGGGNFGDELLGDTLTTVTAVFLEDLDSDGDIDIVAASRGDDTLSWFSNEGQGQFSAERFISVVDRGPNELYVADLDGDQRLDIVVAARTSDQITWHKNEGDGFFAAPQVINDDANAASSVFAVDVDADGDLDLFSTSRNDNKVSLYRNLDGAGTFSDEQILSQQGTVAAQYVDYGDVDGDGDFDVLTASYTTDTIAWHENLGNGRFGAERVISTDTNGTETILLADMDGDGDGDAISASYIDRKIAWYENIDGLGTFGRQRLVSVDNVGVEYVTAADMDGDGDIDLVSASRGDNKVAWYANEGDGQFGPQIVIFEGQTSTTYVATADIDGDGDLDVVANGYEPDNSSLAWFENVNGRGVFGDEILISVDVDLPTAFDISDLDGDGDLDVVTTSGRDDRLVWFENENSRGRFSNSIELSEELDGPFYVRAADFDQDGDNDLVVVALNSDEVVWLENDAGQGFSDVQLIGEAAGPSSVAVVDLDGDMDLDVVVSEADGDQISWFRNLGGEGNLPDVPGDLNGDRVADGQDADLLCFGIDSGTRDSAFDLNGDQFIDGADMTELITNVLGTTFGDVNFDGVFNSSDFVAVFVVGEYEDDVVGNSGYTDGDWNCDGDYTSADLVLALTAGGFSAAAKPTPALVDAAIAAAVADADKPRRAFVS